jgi:hypothetical protein
VFCFRVTDVEQDPFDSDRFTFELEFLNWTNQPAHGAYVWTNIGTRLTEGALPSVVGATVDPDGRGGPRGGTHIGPGVYNVPAHQSGRGRGDIPFHLNDWTVVFRGPTSVFWGDDGSGSATPIPFRSLLTAPSSASQYALVPGLGNDGLLRPDSAIDGGPPLYGPPTQPAPFPAGGQPNPDGSGNVLDGFTLTVDDFDEGEVLSMNWILTDANGDSIGSIGSGGNVVGNQMGFGLFNLVRVPVGGSMPDGIFVGNSGFVRGTNFYQDVYDVPVSSAPGAAIAASFGVEFGPALLAPPLNPNPTNEVPPTITVPIPDIDPTVTPPNTNIAPCSYQGRGDANGSGTVNVSDVQCVLLLAVWELGGKLDAIPACFAGDMQAVELNCDDVINVADVQLVIGMVLAKPLPAEIDANGNQCPDSCDCSAAFCNDNNACTIDICSIDGGCLNQAFNCNDGDPCTIDSCSPATGCVFAVVGCQGTSECPGTQGKACDDGNPCTEGDQCQLGACLGAPVDCNDNNPCTSDQCGAGGCTHQPLANGALCNGLNQCIQGFCVTATGCSSSAQCNGADACTQYACQPVAGMPGQNKCVVVSQLQCDDSNDCTDDVCSPSSGCIYTANDNNTCNDGDDCNEVDKCLGGQCVGLGEVCDDGNPCSVDYCAPSTACYATPLDGPVCDDGNACTQDEFCQIGHCLGDPVDCDDNSVCTLDSCIPASGCAYADISCDDGDVCTNDICDDTTGCEHPFNTAPCDDNSVCTTADTCASGACVGTVVPCQSDGVACTVEVCNPQSGCSSQPSNALCSDGVSCTVDVCSMLTGCAHTPNDGLCNDGIGCTLDTCSATQGCIYTQDDAVCEDGNPCTDNACGPVSGCISLPNAEPCDDGNPLTVGDTCASGACVPGAFVGPFDTCWRAAAGDGATEWNDIWNITFDTLLVNNPLLFTSTYVEFNEQTPPDGDLVSLEMDLPPGLTDFDFRYLIEGISFEDSAAWLFFEDEGGTFHNIECINTNATDGTPPLTAAELAQIPYTCAKTGLFFAWDKTIAAPTTYTPVKLHLRVLLTKGSGFGDFLRAFEICVSNIQF